MHCAYGAFDSTVHFEGYVKTKLMLVAFYYCSLMTSSSKDKYHAGKSHAQRRSYASG
jgi:hypothetical protein